MTKQEAIEAINERIEEEYMALDSDPEEWVKYTVDITDIVGKRCVVHVEANGFDRLYTRGGKVVKVETLVESIMQ